METNLKIYTGQAAKVLNFLKGGCTPAQAAQAVGVSEPYVSQLCAEEDFQKQIAQKLQHDFEQALETDKNLDEIEHLLTKKIKQLVPYMIGLDDVLKTFRVVNQSNRKLGAKINPAEGNNGVGVKTITLLLPKIIINNFITNPNSEVVAIDDRNLVTLNSSSIDSLAKKVMEEETIDILTEQIPKMQLSKLKVPNVQPKDKWDNL